MQEFYKKNWIPIFHHDHQHHALQEISFLFSPPPPPLLFIQKTERKTTKKSERERCALYTRGIPTHMDIMHTFIHHTFEKHDDRFYPLIQTYIHT